MTTDSGPRAKLDRLAEAMVEDLFETPDEELLAEVDPEAVMRTAEADLEAVRIRWEKNVFLSRIVAAIFPPRGPAVGWIPKTRVAASLPLFPDMLAGQGHLGCRSGDDIRMPIRWLIEIRGAGLDLGERGIAALGQAESLCGPGITEPGKSIGCHAW